MSDVPESVVFPAALAHFSARLAAADIAIYGVAYQFLHFGGWVIELGQRHRRFLLSWDGKEHMLKVESSVASDSRSPPKALQQLAELNLPPPLQLDEIFEQAEAVVLSHNRT
jgi:hypothetical protein